MSTEIPQDLTQTEAWTACDVLVQAVHRMAKHYPSDDRTGMAHDVCHRSRELMAALLEYQDEDAGGRLWILLNALTRIDQIRYMVTLAHKLGFTTAPRVREVHAATMDAATLAAKTVKGLAAMVDQAAKTEDRPGKGSGRIGEEDE